MKFVPSIPDLKAARRKMQESLGFMPTMGYLHEGPIDKVILD